MLITGPEYSVVYEATVDALYLALIRSQSLALLTGVRLPSGEVTVISRKSTVIFQNINGHSSNTNGHEVTGSGT